MPLQPSRHRNDGIQRGRACWRRLSDSRSNQPSLQVTYAPWIDLFEDVQRWIVLSSRRLGVESSETVGTAPQLSGKNDANTGVAPTPFDSRTCRSHSKAKVNYCGWRSDGSPPAHQNGDYVEPRRESHGVIAERECSRSGETTSDSSVSSGTVGRKWRGGCGTSPAGSRAPRSEFPAINFEPVRSLCGRICSTIYPTRRVRITRLFRTRRVARHVQRFGRKNRTGLVNYLREFEAGARRAPAGEVPATASPISCPNSSRTKR